MDETSRAFKELTAMIGSERDARRADVKEVRAHLQAIDEEMAAADERTSGFEAALLESLETLRDALARRADAQDALEARVADLEQWRRDQAS